MSEFSNFTRTIKVGQDTATFRADTVEDLVAQTKEYAELAGEFAAVDASIRNTFGVSAAAEAVPPKEAPKRGAPARRPSSKPQARARPAAQTAEVCECGEPYNDVRGKTYQKGPKAGQNYPNDFYPSCNNNECKPWSE